MKLISDYFKESKKPDTECYGLYSDRGEYLGVYETFTESQSLSRVWSTYHKYGFVTLSAFRDQRSEEENLELHVKLQQQINDLDLGYWEVNGGYQDLIYHRRNADGSDAGVDPEKPISLELSLYVAFNPNGRFSSFWEFAEALRKLACSKPYEQDSILAVPPVSDEDSVYYLTSKGLKSRVGAIVKLDKAGAAFTQLRKGSHAGRTFTVESIGVRTGKGCSVMERSRIEASARPDRQSRKR